jgi:hypothetical protein
MDSIHLHDYDVYCIALATYSEARTFNEKTSVIHLIANRIRSGKFGADACEVTFSRGQFNGISDIVSGKHEYPDKKTMLQHQLLVVNTLYRHKHTNLIAHSLYFHDKSIADMSKTWKRKKVTRVDSLTFY